MISYFTLYPSRCLAVSVSRTTLLTIYDLLRALTFFVTHAGKVCLSIPTDLFLKIH